jgi:NAD(P)-dependent dehydrogenase (short-subunit alcohol dehydrogenase family)
MTKALAREVAHHGITANIIAPGHIDTPLTRAGAALGWWDDEEELRGISSGRAGSATDVAAALMLFASQEAGWITGQTLHVNGGSLMW